MKNAIAVMNTKGGVGKSTVVLGLAETLSTYEGKSVLVIDSDAQASVSSMLMSTTQLYELQSNGLTLVEYLVNSVLNNQTDDVKRYLVPGVSDVDDANSVTLFPSDVQLTLFEREVSHEQRHTQLRKAISDLLDQVRPLYDIVLIDCPPGLSVLTESWLREADFHLTPTKPDYISSCGLEVFRRFKTLNPEMGFAENLGVVINMKDRMSPADDEYHKWLASDAEHRCFDVVVPRASPLQDASRFQLDERSYPAKYPGDAGKQMRALVGEIMQRMTDGPPDVKDVAPEGAEEPAVQAEPTTPAVDTRDEEQTQANGNGPIGVTAEADSDVDLSAVAGAEGEKQATPAKSASG
ncbi:MAG: ParA family protein [Hyphomicrobiaceae bacterium]